MQNNASEFLELAFWALAAIFLVSAILEQRRLAVLTKTEQRLGVQERHLAFNRNTVRAVTGGRLILCEPDELHSLISGERLWTLPLLQDTDVSLFRTHLREIASRRGFSNPRMDDLCSCVTEAAANAVHHGHGGIAQVWGNSDGLAILVSDNGQGLSPNSLLTDSMGMGFMMMLAMADQIALSTSAEGTEILLIIQNRVRSFAEDHYLTCMAAA